MIEIKELKKTYGKGETKVHALRGVSLNIKKGEFVAIMGASGSGKSTLLHQLGLLDEPTSGTYKINSHDILSLHTEQKTHFRLNDLGYVFQEYALLPELTSLENVVLPLMMNSKIDKRKITIKSAELLRDFGIGNKLSRPITQLSGGEQQRVAIARALANNPKILLADEPCANLDTENSSQVLSIFKKLNKQLKQTIIMVTHEDWHTKYVSRVIKLRDGRIISDRKRFS